MIHPGGGYKIALSTANDNYVATAGRPGNTLKILHVKNKQAVVSANLEVCLVLRHDFASNCTVLVMTCFCFQIFGGFAWHYRLPFLCVGNNSKLLVFKIPAK